MQSAIPEIGEKNIRILISLNHKVLRKCVHSDKVDRKVLDGERLQGTEPHCHSLYGCIAYLDGKGPPCDGFVGRIDAYANRCVSWVRARNLESMGRKLSDEQRYCLHECKQQEPGKMPVCYINVRNAI